jgi:hypothetical protein
VSARDDQSTLVESDEGTLSALKREIPVKVM